MSRPELPKDLEVFVESIDEEGRATYITGFFEFRGNPLKFGAIAMEGYGGPNIAATLPDETLSALRGMKLDEDEIDELITALQRNIMEGGAHIQLRNDAAKNEGQVSKTNSP